MEKQVKININGIDYYCDSEVCKLIMRNDDKRESLEYQNKELNSYLDTHFDIEHNLVERVKELQWELDTLKENNKGYLDRIVEAIHFIEKYYRICGAIKENEMIIDMNDIKGNLLDILKRGTDDE